MHQIFAWLEVDNEDDDVADDDDVAIFIFFISSCFINFYFSSPLQSKILFALKIFCFSFLVCFEYLMLWYQAIMYSLLVAVFCCCCFDNRILFLLGLANDNDDNDVNVSAIKKKKTKRKIFCHDTIPHHTTDRQANQSLVAKKAT